MTPPDSGEREVCGATFTRDGKVLVCRDMPHHDPAHAMQMAERRREAMLDEVRPEKPVVIPLPLAQRILAALTDAWPRTEGERDRLRALAAELRACVEGKS